MGTGFIVQNSLDGSRQDKWLPGEPEKSWLRGIKVDSAEMIPVVTYRCKACGFLESYAKN